MSLSSLLLLFFQLFVDGSSVLDITQIYEPDNLGTTPKSKRQRLDSGWEVLRDLVNPTEATIQVIPW